jgi:hypothetical protein
MTTMTQGFQLEPAAVKELRRIFHGELIERSHPAYGEHRRLWNGSIAPCPLITAAGLDTPLVRSETLGHRAGARCSRGRLRDAFGRGCPHLQ